MSTQYGLPLAAPSQQAILPVMISTGLVVGFFSITSQAFTNPLPATFTLPEGPIQITTVTPDVMGTEGNGPLRVSQFVAVVYDFADGELTPWIGYGGFISANDTGYYSRWSLPTYVQKHYQDQGVLLKGLGVSMNSSYVAPPVPPAPNPQNAAIAWVASMNVVTDHSDFGFFDFPWMTLFQESVKGSNPVRISTVSNPPGGYFKSTVVSGAGSGGQVYLPGGAVVFDTVRIILLHPAAAGSYVFQFLVTDSLNQSTPVQLTLTIS